MQRVFLIYTILHVECLLDLFLTYSLELSLLSKSLFNYSCLILQELEIQARAHGLPTLASLVTVDLGAHITKPQTHLEQNSGDYCQQLVLSQGTSPELCDQAMAFSDPLSHFTDLSFSAALKEEQKYFLISVAKRYQLSLTSVLLNGSSVHSPHLMARCPFTVTRTVQK